MKIKICTKCGKEKPLSEFNKQKTGKNGYRADCRECQKVYFLSKKEYFNQLSRDYRIANLEDISIKKKEWYENNKEEKLKKDKEYRDNHKEQIKIKKKEYRDKNKESIKQKKKQYYEDNKDTILEKMSVNQKKRRKQINKYLKNKRDTDINYKISIILRNRLRALLEKRLRPESALDLLGCSLDFFHNYIESKFQPGMSWDNHGRGNCKWHLDHIRPCASFDLRDIEQQKECFHYSNYQPLWQHDNLSKSSKY